MDGAGHRSRRRFANAGGARAVWAYLALAYLLAWAWWLPPVLAGDRVGPGGWPSQLPGLAGPALAAVAVTAVTGRRGGVAVLLSSLGRWRLGWWWAFVLAPLAPLAAGLTVAAASHEPLTEFTRIDGVPSWGVAGVTLLLLAAAAGEETGWRGFLQPRLQDRFGVIGGLLLVALCWLLWHAPLFVFMPSYRELGPVSTVGFAVGLVSGAFVLGWLYNRTGSLLAVVVWHFGYNITVSSAWGSARFAVATSVAVIVLAVALVVADVVRGGSVLSPRRR